MSNSLKIAVIEWICGGGLSDVAISQLSLGLRKEGWAMLATLVQGLAADGSKVVVPIDPRLTPASDRQWLVERAEVVDIPTGHAADSSASWVRIAKQCDWTWVIAPEIDNKLLQVVASLRDSGASLLNCRNPFLSFASDKLCTFDRLSAAGVPTPPTQRLERLDTAWLDQNSHRAQSPRLPNTENPTRWVIKPADGAGGEGLRIVDRVCLESLQRRSKVIPGVGSQSNPAKSLVVQPWLDGVALSCSALIDLYGRAHWLPLVSQDFASIDWNDAEAQPSYLGCSYPPPDDVDEVPRALLDQAVRSLDPGAAGWIGIDLLHDPYQKEWFVIEVNPRCTTSLVGLSRAYRGNLVGELLGMYLGTQVGLTTTFRPLTYRVS